uniref:DEAD/DEAH box helicase family protein n=1 Tax=Desulfovibrio sp. ZJ369 TaxID=2709793 RepID=UPI0013EBA96D
MAGRRKKQAAPQVDLNTTFYRELFRFYRENKGSIRSHYRGLTRELLDYNDPDRPRPGQFLRRPQFEALEIHVFLKEYLKLRPVHDIFADWYKRRKGFEKRGDVLGMDGQYVLENSPMFNEAAYAAVFKRMKAARQDYANYIFALTMGVGKTLLMATCIFYDFVLARKFPDDPLYCHNALIFAPDKTVLQSLREIESFDFARVLPPKHANWLQANLKLQYLDEAGATLNVLNNSDYNLVISNTQKILLKRKKKSPSRAEQLFLATGETKTADARSVYDDISDLYGFDSPEDEADLTINQRFLKLRNLPQLGIFVDEAHHAFGDVLKTDLLDPKKETSLRFTINTLARGIKRLGSSMVACCNFTGTPYVKNELLPEVVYSYSLKDAINNGYLKTLRLHKFANTRDREFVRAVVDDFLERFDGRALEGMLPKLVFFSPSIEDATKNLRPILEEELNRRDIPVSQ